MAVASFLGATVEWVEALTVVLAAGLAGGWRPAMWGAGTALGVLAGVVLVVGAPLQVVVQITWVQGFLGLFMLLFGSRWLLKAVFRYGGVYALHDETAKFRKTREGLQQDLEGTASSQRIGFATAFGSTLVEGMEAAFIVVTFGAAGHALGAAVIGAGVALLVVGGVAVILRQPLARVPENSMKYVVAVMITSFGVFWLGQAIGINWPDGELGVLWIVLSLVALSGILVGRCRYFLSRVAMRV